MIIAIQRNPYWSLNAFCLKLIVMGDLQMEEFDMLFAGPNYELGLVGEK